MWNKEWKLQKWEEHKGDERDGKMGILLPSSVCTKATSLPYISQLHARLHLFNGTLVWIPLAVHLNHIDRWDLEQLVTANATKKDCTCTATSVWFGTPPNKKRKRLPLSSYFIIYQVLQVAHVDTYGYFLLWKSCCRINKNQSNWSAASCDPSVSTLLYVYCARTLVHSMLPDLLPCLLQQ